MRFLVQLFACMVKPGLNVRRNENILRSKQQIDALLVGVHLSSKDSHIFYQFLFCLILVQTQIMVHLLVNQTIVQAAINSFEFLGYLL